MRQLLLTCHNATAREILANLHDGQLPGQWMKEWLYFQVKLNLFQIGSSNLVATHVGMAPNHATGTIIVDDETNLFERVVQSEMDAGRWRHLLESNGKSLSESKLKPSIERRRDESATQMGPYMSCVQRP